MLQLDPLILYGSLLPELRQFKDKTQRRDALRIATQRMYATWQPYAVVVAWFIVTRTLDRYIASLPRPVEIGSILLTNMLAVWMMFYALASRIRRSLRLQLKQLGEPICVSCGYDIRGQTNQRCSECGSPIET